nr:hypothetical protein CFP56_37085 [Quercus suber]
MFSVETMLEVQNLMSMYRNDTAYISNIQREVDQSGVNTAVYQDHRFGRLFTALQESAYLGTRTHFQPLYVMAAELRGYMEYSRVVAMLDQDEEARTAYIDMFRSRKGEQGLAYKFHSVQSLAQDGVIQITRGSLGKSEMDSAKPALRTRLNIGANLNAVRRHIGLGGFFMMLRMRWRTDFTIMNPAYFDEALAAIEEVDPQCYDALRRLSNSAVTPLLQGQNVSTRFAFETLTTKELRSEKDLTIRTLLEEADFAHSPRDAYPSQEDVDVTMFDDQNSKETGADEKVKEMEDTVMGDAQGAVNKDIEQDDDTKSCLLKAEHELLLRIWSITARKSHAPNFILASSWHS